MVVRVCVIVRVGVPVIVRMRVITIVRMRMAMVMRMRVVVAVHRPVGCMLRRARHRVANILRVRAAAGRAHHASLHFLDLQFLAGDDAQVRAAAGAAAERPFQRHLTGAGVADRARRRLDDFQRRAFDHRVPGANIEAEAQRRRAAPRRAGRSPPARANTRASRRAFGADPHDPVGDAEFMHRGASSADPRQLLADQHIDDAFATETGVQHHHAGRSRGHLADAAAPTPAGCARIAASTRVASAAATTATSLPSFARYSGSRPRISQAPLDLLAQRQRVLADARCRHRAAGEFVQHGGNRRRASRRAGSGSSGRPPASPPPGHPAAGSRCRCRRSAPTGCGRSGWRCHDRRARR